MSSLASSLYKCNPKNLSKHYSGQHRDLHTSQVSGIKLSSQPQKKSSPELQVNEKPRSLLTRRVAIGFGFGVGLLDVLFQLQSSAAAEAGASCELTVATSGLAFCDKVVGNGAEAVKGQLIKVNHKFYPQQLCQREL